MNIGCADGLHVSSLSYDLDQLDGLHAELAWDNDPSLVGKLIELGAALSKADSKLITSFVEMIASEVKVVAPQFKGNTCI